LTNWHGTVDASPSAAPSSSAYLTAAQADNYLLGVADISAWMAADDARRGRALMQASIEIDALQFAGMPYGNWLVGRSGVQERAFPRFIQGSLDDMRFAMRTQAQCSDEGQILDQDAHGQAIVPSRVLYACFLQAMEILSYPDRKARLRDRSQGVTAQAAGTSNEQYDASAPVNLVCMEAMAQLRPYLLKNGRIL
jgi:hypothetical protein